MTTIEHLRQLFAFNDWANRRLIAALKENPSRRARRLLAHLLVTEKEYFRRLYGKDSTGFDFWPDLTAAECGELARETAGSYERLLAGFDDEGLGQSASYKTSEGIPFQNSFREILTHVVLHSTAHRGQVLAAMRADGFAPPAVDYIIYRRERK